MRIGQTLYAAVIKDSGEIFSHPEGDIISEYPQIVRDEVKLWAKIFRMNTSDIEVKKVRLVEVKGDSE